ncbi:hypothetical protein [Sporosarcina sp. HYO08]|uniref:hypothetical protein n=1 Tax=Sporosarcina sp. HYO08 TaxID=1759557 RepID=UPI0007947597|nr:hypothetical protein [Sporosarcina sp. HYO08]KXH81942.1 hypothetical protein AU377_06700 [Sporosarcina sp. HYO08]
MIRMMKKRGNEIHFWQVWKLKRKIVTMTGILGKVGRREEILLGLFERSEKVMKRLAKEKEYEGYNHVDEESLTIIAVQYRYDDEEDDGAFDEASDQCVHVGDLLDQALHDTGNGGIDGAEIGKGAAINFFQALDVELAFKTMVNVLHRHNLLEGAEIAVFHMEDAFIALYPEDADIKFTPSSAYES